MTRREVFEKWALAWSDNFKGTRQDGISDVFDKFEPLIEELEKLSCPEVAEKILIEQDEYTSERSFGNYDDVFNDGCDSAWAGVAIQLRNVLAAFDKNLGMTDE